MKDHVIIACGSDSDMDAAWHLKDHLCEGGHDAVVVEQKEFDNELRDSIKNCKVFAVIVSRGVFDCYRNPQDAFLKGIEYARYYQKDMILLRNGEFEFPKNMPNSIVDLRYMEVNSLYTELRDQVAESLIIEKMPSAESWTAVEEEMQNNILQERPISEMAEIAKYDIQLNYKPCLIVIMGAAAGNQDSQLCLAKYYQDGDQISRSETKAVYWLRQAVRQGNAEAMYLLAQCYEEGKGVARVPKYAAFYYEESAECEKPYPDAIYRVADCYLEGIGVSKKLLKQAYWLREAAKLEAKASAIVYAEKYMELLEGSDEKIRDQLRQAGYLPEDLSPEQRTLIDQLRRERREEDEKRVWQRNVMLEQEERERKEREKRHAIAIGMAIPGGLFSAIAMLGAAWMGWCGFDPRPMPYCMLLFLAAVLCGGLLAPAAEEEMFPGEGIPASVVGCTGCLAVAGTLLYFVARWLHLFFNWFHMVVLWLSANWFWFVLGVAIVGVLIVVIAIMINM